MGGTAGAEQASENGNSAASSSKAEDEEEPQEPVTLTATITLEPDAAAEGDGGPFSAAWFEAALVAAAAQQSPAAPVQLGGAQAGRLGVCGNGICEVGERSVEGSINGTCPQDCGFESKVGWCGSGAGGCSCHQGQRRLVIPWLA